MIKTSKKVEGIFQFSNEAIDIDHAIKILNQAKEKGNKVFFPVMVTGDYNYKTNDCDKQLRLIFSK